MTVAGSLRAGLMALAVAGAGCSQTTDPGSQLAESALLQARTSSDIVLLRMKIVPDTEMQALFDGRVVVDASGCLRLDTVDRHTVVWPKGYEIRRILDLISVVNDAGSVVGVVGGRFVFSGGEMQVLHGGLGFTESDDALAQAHCPGRYWIVGQIIQPDGAARSSR